VNKKIITFLIVLILGSGALVGLYYAIPLLINKKQKNTSDASKIKGVITVGIDSWIGYYPLCSKKMRSQMRASGYRLDCIDDQANYPERMKKLKEDKLNFAVATVDSYLINGKKENFPGTIIAVIDESKGGDAIVAIKTKIASLDDLKQKKNYKIAFTPQSPSEHLLRAIIDHFDVPKNAGTRIETKGSEEALKKLLKGKVDVAILWEPDVTRALNNKNIIKILGTEDTHKLIVDILLVNRDYSSDHPEIVELLLANYFKTLKYYKNKLDKLKKEINEETKLDEKKIDSMLAGVSWVNLHDNALNWFGVDSNYGTKEEGLFYTIESTIEILTNTDGFSQNSIPNDDPYMLLNSNFVADLFNTGLPGQFKSGTQEQKRFAPLAEDRWEELREVGTLKIRPITFQSGSDELNEFGEEQLRLAENSLKHYPNFRVYIKGHTGLSGNQQGNIDLSERRANMVKEHLINALNVEPNRIRAKGFGSDLPLPRRPNESRRAYNYRLSRVELKLVDEVY